MEKPRVQHGLKKHPLYSVWCNMKQRCNNKKDKNHKNYGGKGISVMKKWDSFIPFYNWAIENGWQKGLCIDRKNNDGNYSSRNCRFVTIKINNENRSNCKWWFINGKRFGSIKEASAYYRCNDSMIQTWCNGRTVKGKYYPKSKLKYCYSELKYKIKE